MYMNDPFQPALGELSGGCHTFPLRVYYEDTDAQGVVYYANYLKYFERGRTEMLRSCGIHQSALLSSQSEVTFFVVKKLNIDYKKPARLDDVLTVKTRVLKMQAASLVIGQTIHCEGAHIADAEVKVGVLGDNGRPKKISSELRHQLGAVLTQE